MKAVSLALLASVAAALPGKWGQHKSHTKYMISFGDSYTSTSFNITTGAKPSAENPLGNPPFPGWTSAGGPNWISQLVGKYNNSLLLNYNLAYGGATVNATLIAPYLPTVYSIIDQVTEFNQYLSPPPSYAPWTPHNTLFAWWEGVNDVGNGWYLPDSEKVLAEVMDDYFEQIELVYKGGARHFAFLTCPPTQRSPFIMESEGANYTIPLLTAAIENWNIGLSKKARAFAAAHRDAVIKIVDTQAVFNRILDAGGDKALCYNSDGVTCLWFNDYHPGLAIQDGVARAVAEAWKGRYFL